MKIVRFPKLRYRVFRDFTWSKDLLPFDRFNLIYGRNGTGKTTLSSLFAHLERRENVTEGEVVFEFANGTAVSGSELGAKALPEVRVFNRDFIDKAVRAFGTHLEPIYYIGQDSAEKQARVEGLKEKREGIAARITEAELEKKAAVKAFESFCTERARSISTLLTRSRSDRYSRFNKAHFKRSMEELPTGDVSIHLLSESEQEQSKKQRAAEPKETIGSATVGLPNVVDLYGKARSLLQTEVVSQTLDELASEPQVAAWVQRGMALHTGEHSTDRCRFCGNDLHQERRLALEGHFNDTVTTLQRQIERLLQEVERAQPSQSLLNLPNRAQFYSHLAQEFETASKELGDSVERLGAHVAKLPGALQQKKANPFSRVEPPGAKDADLAASLTAVQQANDRVNRVIAAHNKHTQEFEEQVEGSARKLELHHLAAAKEEYDQLLAATNQVDQDLDRLRSEDQSLVAEIQRTEREVRAHQRPAEQLNAELRAYLGRDELRLQIKENGYTLTRSGEPVRGLSEGEKSAVAFLYFLKTLEDQSFQPLKRGVVVIDDPVSSLDANALFSAFGYLKERTQECGQLFVLTHNFAFFRRVRDWFCRVRGQGGDQKKDEEKPARFFQLRAQVGPDGQRTSRIERLDRLLKKFDSEYHYLFKRVYEEVHHEVDGPELERCYSLPNVGRCLLETFLTFRYPEWEGNLTKLMGQVKEFPREKKAGLLECLQAHSHSAAVLDPEHDPTALAEIRTVLGSVLELIEAADPVHYAGMERLVLKEIGSPASGVRELAQGAEAS